MVFSNVLSGLWTRLLVWVSPMLKWILHKVTGKCQLLRITYEEQPGAQQTKRIEKALKNSKSSLLKGLAVSENADIDKAVEDVVREKCVVVDVHVKFEENLKRCLCYICGYNHLLALVEENRKVKYCRDDAEHEAKLLRLWDLYKAGSPLPSRQGGHWGELGFQGDDPATDFRGMGMLGLHQLLYFVEQHNEEAQSVLLKSVHPKYGFSFAIVGINITDLEYQLLMKRKLRTHFYNLPNPSPSVDSYHELYCYLMSEFTKFWQKEKPRDIMEFSRIRDKFHRHILRLLKDPKATLRADFQDK